MDYIHSTWDLRETDRAQIVFITGKKFEDKTEEELDEIIFEIW